jgi:ATP-dependent Clp endopeptidase proteolytic subunit ClpP
MTPTGRVLEDGTVMLFGVIGDPMDGLDADSVVAAIRELEEPDALEVLINSPGGDVADGLAIHHELATNPARVEVEITAVAASMGSVIAMAGDHVAISENGHVMVHDPWTVAVGDAEDLKKASEMLEQFGTSLAEIYAEKTGLPEEEIRDMMAEETWMTAEEALEQGFVDEIVEPVEAAAFADLDTSELSAVPAAVVRQIREGRAMKVDGEKKKNDGGSGDEPAKNDPTPGNDPASDPAPEPDPGAQGSAGGDDPQADARQAAREAVAAERQRVREIRAVAERHPLPDGWADERIEAGDTVEDARSNALDTLADGQDYEPFVPRAVVSTDARENWVEGASAWLIRRAGKARMYEKAFGETLDPGEFRGFSLMDLARDAVERAGRSTRGMSRKQVAGLALGLPTPYAQGDLNTRSDFPILLENALHKMLLASFETAPDQWRSFCAEGSVTDFREHRRLRRGTIANLDQLLESGEFRQLQIPDGERERIQAETRGNIIGITRQTIINDDVSAFADLVQMLGRAAARSIEAQVFDTLELNGGLGPNLEDGNPVFDAAHANIAADVGTPTQGRLSEARTIMAQQQDPSEHDFLDLRPFAWVGPIGLGDQVRETIGAEYSDESADDVRLRKPNVVRDLLEEVVDTPRLAGDRWYVFADPDLAPVIEVVFLEGETQPQLETEEGFEYDGVRWRVRYDFGVGAVGHRGGVTNAGA